MKTLLITALVLVTSFAAKNSTKTTSYTGNQPAYVHDEQFWLMQDIATYSHEIGVPFKIMAFIAEDESQFRWVKGAYDDLGYFQIIPSTFEWWKKKINAEGVYSITNHDRRANVIVACYYVRHLAERYNNDWVKVRYAYARGSYKERSQWTPMQKAFMAKWEGHLKGEKIIF